MKLSAYNGTTYNSAEHAMRYGALIEIATIQFPTCTVLSPDILNSDAMPSTLANTVASASKAFKLGNVNDDMIFVLQDGDDAFQLYNEEWNSIAIESVYVIQEAADKSKAIFTDDALMLMAINDGHRPSVYCLNKVTSRLTKSQRNADGVIQIEMGGELFNIEVPYCGRGYNTTSIEVFALINNRRANPLIDKRTYNLELHEPREFIEMLIRHTPDAIIV